MHTPTEDEKLALAERVPARDGCDERRSEEEDILHLEGAGFTTGLTKAYRAPRAYHHPIATT